MKNLSQTEVNRREKIAQMTCIFLNDHTTINRATAFYSLRRLVSAECLRCVQNQYMNIRGRCSCKKSSTPCLVFESALTEHTYWTHEED